MPVRKSDRLFQLTNLLRAHQPLTARDLATRLCVSERTIYRYIDDLSLAGIPVYGEAGLGYRLSEGFEMAPLQLSAAELEALITGVNLVAVLTGKGMADPARALLAKIEAALPAKEARAPRVPWCGCRTIPRRTLHTLAGTGCTTPSRPVTGCTLATGMPAPAGPNASSFPSGSSTGADAGRSAPGVRCAGPTGISGWIASTPWRRADREKGHHLARPWPITLPCASRTRSSLGAVAPKRSFRTDTRLSVALRYAGFSRPSTTEKTR